MNTQKKDLCERLLRYVKEPQKIILYSILLLICFTGYSQNIRQLISHGDNAFRSANYFSAIAYYESALKQDTILIDVRFNLAESYRKIFNYIKAKNHYLFISKNDIENKYTESYFWAAMMMKSLGYYDEATIFFQKYIETGAKAQPLVSEKRAKHEIISCEKAKNWKENPVKARVTPESATINTPYSEFNPVPLGDSILIFSSLRPIHEPKNLYEYTGDYLSKIYITTAGNIDWKQTMAFDNNINSNTIHTANISFTKKFEKAYFNRCEYNENNALRCDVWMSVKKYKKWSLPKKLSAPINNPEYTSTHPCVVFDSENNKEILYFSSDRKGGFGGLDLWFVVIDEKNQQEPTNLGSLINTSGDEISPVYDIKTNTLYFSSDWHHGFGGLDIFKSYGALSKWSKPENLGWPVNSGANDFFYFKRDNRESYITSNRPGSMTFRDETCCNDIFLIEYFEDTKEVTKIDTIVIVKDTVKVEIIEKISQYLPLNLFFDNDHPDPRSRKSTTDLNYAETYYSYLQKKKKFIDEYSKGLKGLEKNRATIEMEDFFKNYVDSGFIKLNLFTELLYQDLLNGSKVILKVRGFTSPLTSAEYNIILSQRRISSLINYFKEYEHRILLQCINKTASDGGSLTIIEEPAGEALVNQFVSDNPNDRRLSEFSKAASYERRIQIIAYESEFQKYSTFPAGTPLIQLENNIINLMPYEKEPEVILNIPIKNIGLDTLTIGVIERSCRCMYMLYKPETIAPGKEDHIKLRIIGPFNRDFTEHIIINSNTPDKKNVIHFRGSVN